MNIRLTQDMAAGLLFLTLGAAALTISADYAMGTPQRPGSGVLPRILGWALSGTGALLIAKALIRPDAAISAWAWRPFVLVTLAVVAFALLVDRAGLVVAMIASMVLVAAGSHETRWGEAAVFGLALIVVAVLLFVKLLGMPITVLPRGLAALAPWA